MMEQIYSTLASLPWWAGPSLIIIGLWGITSRVKLTRLHDANREVDAFFNYKSDGVDSWRVLSPENPDGDCDDYVATVIGVYSGSGLAFLWNISNPLKFRVWYVTDPVGISHAIAVCNGVGFDNHKKRLVPVSTYKQEGYKFRFPWPFPLILLKLAIGKFK